MKNFKGKCVITETQCAKIVFSRAISWFKAITVSYI